MLEGTDMDPSDMGCLGPWITIAIVLTIIMILLSTNNII